MSLTSRKVNLVFVDQACPLPIAAAGWVCEGLLAGSAVLPLSESRTHLNRTGVNMAGSSGLRTVIVLLFCCYLYVVNPCCCCEIWLQRLSFLAQRPSCKITGV